MAHLSLSSKKCHISSKSYFILLRCLIALQFHFIFLITVVSPAFTHDRLQLIPQDMCYQPQGLNPTWPLGHNSAYSITTFGDSAGTTARAATGKGSVLVTNWGKCWAGNGYGSWNEFSRTIRPTQNQDDNGENGNWDGAKEGQQQNGGSDAAEAETETGVDWRRIVSENEWNQPCELSHFQAYTETPEQWWWKWGWG